FRITRQLRYQTNELPVVANLNLKFTNKEFTEFKTKPEIQISEEAEIHVERLNLTDIKNLRRIYFP
ncbi:hypothetical protein ABJZ39_13080, partial [Enterococcus faecium]